jgi:DNA polymerase III subunit delta'
MRFAQLIGHQMLQTHVRKAIQETRLGHALLLKGPAGVGKLGFASAIAQYVNCQQPTNLDSCGQCPSCQKIDQAIHPDLHFVLPIYSKIHGGQALSTDDFMGDFRAKWLTQPFLSLEEWTTVLEAYNKQLMIPIHEIRQLKRKLSLQAFEGRFKVVIIWHADKMKTEAANALLKLLEEPPDQTLLLLTADDDAALLPTITSRCQLLQFGRLSRPLIASYLVHQLKLNTEEAEEVALLSEGSMTRALQQLEHTQQPFTDTFVQWMRACYDGKVQTIQRWQEGVQRLSREHQKLLMVYTLHMFREVLLLKLNLDELTHLNAKERTFIERFATTIPINALEPVVEGIEKAIFHLSRNANANMVFFMLSLHISRSFVRKTP